MFVLIREENSACPAAHRYPEWAIIFLSILKAMTYNTTL